MRVYLDLVILINFLVDWLLLIGTNRLTGFPPGAGRSALAALVGGLYAGACMLPGFSFLGSMLWRTVSLLLMAPVAFGFSRSSLRRGVVFLLLSMALGGIALGAGNNGIWGLLVSAGVVCLMCYVGFRGKIGGESFVPVELCYEGKKVKLTALRDTGNTLHDPVTGSPVLILEGEQARKLTGLTETQLRQPVESMGALPGLRLIPYRAIGTDGGLLLALRLQNVRIGTWQGSQVVAFAPEKLSLDGTYQALTGGVA